MTPRILVGQSLRLYALFLGAQCLGVFALWLLFDPPGPVMQTATDAQYAKFGTWMVLASLLFWKAGRVADRVTPARRSSLAFPGAGLALASLSVVGVGMGVRALGLLITDRVSIAGLDPGAEALVKAADSTIRNLILLGVGCVLVAGPRLAAYLRGSPRMESAPFSPPPFAAASLKLLAILMIAMALRGLETWPVLLEHVAEMSRLISPNNRFLEPGDVEQFELLMSLERSLVRVHLFPVVFMLAFGVGLLTRWGSIGTGNRPVPGTAAPMAELTHGALRAFALGGIAALSVVNACQRAAWYGTRGTPWYDAGVVLLSLALAAALFLMVSRDRMRTDKDTKVDAYWIQAPLGSAGLLRAACAGAALWLGLYAVTCAGRWWLDEAPPFDGTSMAEFGIGHWGRVGTRPAARRSRARPHVDRASRQQRAPPRLCPGP